MLRKQRSGYGDITMRYLKILSLATSLLFIASAGGALADDAISSTSIDGVVVEKKIRKRIFAGGDKQLSEDPGPEDAYSIKFVVISKLRYDFIDESVVVDGNGKNLSPNELPVPCEADLTYQTVGHGTRNILSLRVLRKLPSSTQQWSQFPPD